MTADKATWRRRRLSSRDVSPSPNRPAALAGDGAMGNEPALRELHVTVPLKPQGDAPPANLSSAVFAGAIQDEYATRYLARLGARATPENVAMVLNSLPLERCQLTAAWRARGALVDELSIDLYAPKPTSVTASSGSSLNGGRSTQSEPQGGAVHCVEGPTAAESVAGTSFYCFGPVCWSFDDIKRKFLPPFCDATPPSAPVAIGQRKVASLGINEDSGAIPTADDSSSLAAAAAAVNGATVSQILGRRETLQRQQCEDERRSPPDTRRETICAMHRAFFSSLPLASLGLASRSTSGSERDLAQRLLDALVGDTAVLELAQRVVLLLYHGVFVPRTSKESHAAAPNCVEPLLVDCVRLFATVRGRYSAWRAPSSLTASASSIVPLLLLALRVDVETLFRMQYPRSFASSSSTTVAETHRVLAAMNARISSLLDPDRHWSCVPVLESSCAAGAARTAPGFQRQCRRERLRDQFFRTSEALHCVFPAPVPGSSRRIMAVGGGAQAARYSSDEPALGREEETSGAVSVAAKLRLLRLLQLHT